MNATFTDEDVQQLPLPAEDAPAPPDAAIDLILLDPTKVRLFHTGGSTVRATITDLSLGSARTFLRVQIARAYPLSEPNRFIGLRDEKDKDIGMMESLVGIDAVSATIVAEELERRYFLPKIRRVRSVKDEYGTITMEVETDRGDRTFFVQNLKESVMDLPPKRLILTDRDGIRWEFPDTDELVGKARTVLQRVL
jgi:hypothetical protein